MKTKLTHHLSKVSNNFLYCYLLSNFKIMNKSKTLVNLILLKHFSNSSRYSVEQLASTSTNIMSLKAKAVDQGQRLSQHCDFSDRQIAPWVPIGDFEKGLLSHLSTSDIFRALFVLKLCSYDFVVDRSLQMFHLSQKLGSIGEFFLRKTFFNQFVGGDKVSGMTEVAKALQTRGLTLMVLPVLEEDVEDVKSKKNTYDENLTSLLDITALSASLENRKPIMQLKMSAIMPAKTLEQVSRAIESRSNKKGSNEITASLITEIGNSVENPENLTLKMNCADQSYFLDGVQRADILVKRAKDLKVNILVDAEFYSCKPAISAIALALMARHNSIDHVVGNTIQGYLKDAVPTIKSELEIITKEIGVNWYGKIVRGAYVDKERYLANKHGYLSPVCDTYEETSESYNKTIQHVLEHLAQKKGNSHLIVATHNEKSIRLACKTMKDLNICPQDPFVSFAQIYGMADYLSTPLVQTNYRVYKSTPYGPIWRVMPYLARRASENRSVMMGAREERSMLLKELQSRMNLSQV